MHTPAPAAQPSIVELPAVEQLRALADGAVTSVELLDAHLEVIDARNEDINAIVTMDREAAYDASRSSDDRRRRGRAWGALDGLPLVVKDTEETAGMRTTFGSPLHAGNVPTHDALVIERVRAAGAVILGKTNVPEFAAGSHTVNPVFGTTANPYAPGRSAGGSSGGSAAALAARMVPLATGSDMGGSLRNPAAFCNVVGLRPSTGRVPTWPGANLWQTMIVNGPMARTTADIALLLSVMAGEDRRAPLSLPGDGSEYRAALHPDAAGLRIGWSRTLDGLDIDPSITAALERDGRDGLREAGATLCELEPRIAEFDDVFRVLRAFEFAQAFGPVVDEHPDAVGDLVRENVEWGRRLTLDEVGRAAFRRSDLYNRFLSVFDDVDVLAAPATAVPAFDAAEPWVRHINGVPQPDYLEWMRTAWRITPTGFTAISVPCGFTPEGLPVGIQFIAPPRAEALLLRVAHAFETRRPFWRSAPPIRP